MDGTQIPTLGLGLQAPCTLRNQNLDMSVLPHRLELYVEAERGTLYPCPECGEACPADNFADKTWRHLNFSQYHCYLHARVPRTKCPEHGVKRIEALDFRADERSSGRNERPVPGSSVTRAGLPGRG